MRLLTRCGGRGAHPAMIVMVVNEATTVAAQYALAQFSDGDGTSRAATRSSATAVWGATQTINGPVACGTLGPTCSGPLAASINNKGHAVVIFATSDPVFTRFAIWAAAE